MALQTHRFRLAVPSVADLAKVVVGGGSLVAGPSPSTPVFVDYRIDDGNANSLIQLTEELAKRGYSYDSLNPGTTPTAAAASLLGVSSASKLWIDEDFLTSNVDTDEIGRAGWRSNTSGTGADISIVPGTVGRAGVIRLGAGTAAAAKSDVHIGDSVEGGHFLVNSTQGQWDYYWDVMPGGSLDILNLEIMQFGLGLEWTLTGILLNGIVVRFLPGVDTFWTLYCVNGGVPSFQPGTTPPALNTWVRLGVRITYPGGVPTAQLMVNDVAQGTPITTNFPTSALGVGAKIDGQGAAPTEAFVHIDSCEVKQAL